MMRFLVHAQLPPELARWLEERGHTAEHVFDRGMAAADDRIIWDFAVSVDAVIITKDEDFAIRRAHAPDGPVVVWIRRGNTTRSELLRCLESILPDDEDAMARGEPLIEII